MKRSVCIAILGLALCCGALAQEQPRRVELRVADDGRYVLEGKVVRESELTERLREIRSRYKSIDFHVVGTPKSSYERVSTAVRAAQEAGLPILQGWVMPPSSAAASSSGVAR